MGRTATAALLIGAALGAGCGDDERPARATTVTGGQSIRVKGDEYSFDPGRITVTRADSELGITLVNEGRLAHNLIVMDGERELGGLRSFPAGEERTLRVRLPPGSYRLVCTVADHEELGMTGEIEVER